MKIISAFVFLVSMATAFAAPKVDLGKELKYALNDQGKPAFGIQYTYGNDPDGKRYLITFSPSIPPSDKSKTLLWNFYIANEADFLMSWDNKRSTQLGIVQVMASSDSAVEMILKNQGEENGENRLYFVLADPTSLKPVYFIPISKLCAQFPAHFADLTNGSRCDQIVNP
jgi:hypothetical protein